MFADPFLADVLFPVDPLHSWLDQHHRDGIDLKLVRESPVIRSSLPRTTEWVLLTDTDFTVEERTQHCQAEPDLLGLARHKMNLSRSSAFIAALSFSCT